MAAVLRLEVRFAPPETYREAIVAIDGLATTLDLSWTSVESVLESRWRRRISFPKSDNESVL